MLLQTIRSGFLLFVALTTLLTMHACRAPLPPATGVIVIQPFGDVSDLQIKTVYQNLKKINANTLLKQFPFPYQLFIPQESGTEPIP